MTNLRAALKDLRLQSDSAYCKYIDQMSMPECLGYESKLASGKFGKTELDSHQRAGEFLGKHQAFSEAVRKIDAALAAAPPADVREDVVRCLYETAPSFSYDECAKMADALITSGLVAPDTTAAAPQADAEPVIKLRPAEIQSGLDRVKWAECLIRLLPEDHDGRNSWLLNYAGAAHEADKAPRPPSQAADRMRENLKGRDMFIVSKGLWSEFVATLSRADEGKESEGGK